MMSDLPSCTFCGHPCAPGQLCHTDCLKHLQVAEWLLEHAVGPENALLRSQVREKFGIDDRTFRSWLPAIRAAGYPVCWRRKRPGGYFVSFENQDIRPLKLSLRKRGWSILRQVRSMERRLPERRGEQKVIVEVVLEASGQARFVA